MTDTAIEQIAEDQATNEGTIGSWTVPQLVRYIREYVFLEPPSSFTTLSVDDLTVHNTLNVMDQVSHDPSTIYIVGFANAPGFQNSWVNVGGAYLTARYWKDMINHVHLDGSIKTGATGTVAFTLPPGFRPVADIEFLNPTDTGTVTVKVGSNGNVTMTFAGTPTRLSLTGITFLTMAV